MVWADVLAEQIRTEREALIDLLVTLDDEQWTTPSLCEGWRVEDVAAHLAWIPVLAPVEMPVMFVRARFSINGYIFRTARRWSERGRDAIVSQLRVNARRGAKPLGVPRDGGALGRDRARLRHPPAARLRARGAAAGVRRRRDLAHRARSAAVLGDGRRRTVPHRRTASWSPTTCRGPTARDPRCTPPARRCC